MRKIDVKTAVIGRLRGLKDRIARSLYQLLPGSFKFSHIHRRNYWGDDESVSGSGSNLNQTRFIREELPRVVKALEIRRFLDVPCGDFHWMKEVPLGVEHYLGGDIVPRIVAQNNDRYGAANRNFIRLDITIDSIPKVDLIFCRDCLVHLALEEARRAVANFRSSGSTYLLTTTFPSVTKNEEIVTGEWRPLNLEMAPFSLPAPLQIINEGCTEQGGKYADKSLGLWKLNSVS